MNKFLIQFLIIIAGLYLIIPAVKLNGQNEFDEISVFLEVQGVGAGEINAVINGQDLFLPVTDLFDFLKIKNVPSQGLETITGFFINPEATYSIDRTKNQIEYQGKTYDLGPGEIIRTESNLYLKSIYFGKVFGLDCNFNFRSLSVTVKSKLELPLIREMRQEEMRQNITRLKGETTADTTVKRAYPLFKFGMADWSVSAEEELKGKSDARVDLALGAMVAGGEANALLYYDSKYGFAEKQQYYLWRYVNNDFQPLRQVMAGKIATNSISSIYNPVVGIQLTNTPTTYRRSFGSYTLSDKTEPGWIVELYVNNVLVDYIKADASGFFSFQVPLVYGNSIVKLKFFGPWGEERVKEQNINIPFNFLPVNTLEYTVSAGIVEDSTGSRFTRANLNYGVTRSLTLGGGVEYLSSVVAKPAMPFMNASFRITNNLLLFGEIAPGVRSKGTLSYRLPSNTQLDLNYTWYAKDQKAISYNYLEERKAVLSMPVKLGKFATFQRFSVYQIVLPTANYTTGEWLFSGSLAGVSTNLTTYALFTQENKPYVYGNLSLGIRLPGELVLIPQAQYGYSENKLISAKMSIEKHLTQKAFLNLSYEQVFQTSMKMAELGFRYDFSFAQTGASVRQSDKTTSFIQYARGSLINDSKTKYHGADNRTNVGKGGIAIISFLDLNANGKRDPGEPKSRELNVHASGGRIEKSDRDSTVRILQLEPYTNCFIELDPNSFDNISWRLPFLTINVAVDPNIIKNIEVPINVVGEATGRILLEKDGEKKGIGRIIVSIKGNQRSSVKTLTEDDGYFSYFGIAPGKYSVVIDSSQLNKLKMSAEPLSRDFEIKAGTDGDIVDGLDFNLKMKQSDSIKIIIPEKQVTKKDTSYLIVHEVSQELVTITEDSYAIQTGAFAKKSNAESYRKKIAKMLNKPVEIITEDNLYKVRISDIKERSEVDADIAILHQNGVNELWVISLKARRKQLIVTEKRDTITNITETENPMIPVNPEVLVQLGAFRQASNAIKLQEKISAATIQKVTIVNENGFYKVRLAVVPLVDQTVMDVMKKLEGSIGKLSLKDIWILPLVPLPVKEPAPVQHIEGPEPVKTRIEIPALKEPVVVPEIRKGKLIAPEIIPDARFSIQAGVYHSQSDALHAQKKITSKLKLPVEIVKQYEYYHVLVTGFRSREETFEYYPELAGLGFTEISVIER